MTPTEEQRKQLTLIVASVKQYFSDDEEACSMTEDDHWELYLHHRTLAREANPRWDFTLQDYEEGSWS